MDRNELARAVGEAAGWLMVTVTPAGPGMLLVRPYTDNGQNATYPRSFITRIAAGARALGYQVVSASMAGVTIRAAA